MITDILLKIYFYIVYHLYRMNKNYSLNDKSLFKPPPPNFTQGEG